MFKRKDKKKDFKLRKPTEISVEIGYTNEQKVETADNVTFYETTNISASRTEDYNAGYSYFEGENHDITVEKNYSDKLEFTNDYAEGCEYLDLFSLKSMRERSANGETTADMANDMENFIIENWETNPDAVQRAIAQFYKDMDNHYDNCLYIRDINNFLKDEGYHRISLGENLEEVISGFINLEDDEEKHGNTCSTMGEAVLHLLNKVNAEAVLLSGGTAGGNHTTVLWRRSDGKYVQSNYGKSYTLEGVNNIIDAAYKIYHDDLGLRNNGYIYFIDKDKMYSRYSMEDVAVWGEELDKRFYNNRTPFSKNIENNPSISGKVNISNFGMSAEAKFTAAYENGETAKSTTLKLAGKQGTGAAIADKYSSIGGELEHGAETETKTGKRYSSTKVIVDLTKLHTDDQTIGHNYLNALKGRTLNPKDRKAFEEFYGKEYEECDTPMHQLTQFLNYYTKRFETLEIQYETIGSFEDSPVSKKEFIDDYNTKYKISENPEPGENAWRDYLIKNAYNGCLEAAQEKIDYYQDHIDNYETYKQEYIDSHINQVSEISQLEGDTYDIKGFDATHLSTMVRQEYGKETTLFSDGKYSLENGMNISGLLGINICTDNVSTFGGDVRLAAEEGLKFNYKDKTSIFSTYVSGGVVGDLALVSGELTPKIAPGIKLNGGSVFQTKLNDKLTIGAGIDAGALVKEVSTDAFYNVQAQASYQIKPETTIFGSTKIGSEKESIRIGTFNQQTDNNMTFGVSIGAKFGKNKTVQLNYNHKNDKLNPTRNKTMFSVSGTIGLN